MNDTHSPYSAQQVLDFWFGPEDQPGYGEARKEWFEKNDAFDEEIREKFGGLHAAVAQGLLDYFWKDSPLSNLAAVIVLDQFSRQLYRDDAKAFAQDGHALTLAKHALEQGFDQQVPEVHRMFFYLPFEHSENLEDQDRSVALFAQLDNAEWNRYAQAHRDVVARFGRCPHRNKTLGRESTPEEEAYLAQPGSGF